MKHSFLKSALIIFGILFSQTAFSGPFGLGVIVGEPTGISVKNWIGETTAIDGGLAWSFGNTDAIHIHADYLFHCMDIFKIESASFDLHYGIGGRIITTNDAIIGARIPVGLNHRLESAPIDFFLELAGILNLTPDTDFDITGGVGARYYF